MTQTHEKEIKKLNDKLKKITDEKKKKAEKDFKEIKFLKEKYQKEKDYNEMLNKQLVCKQGKYETTIKDLNKQLEKIRKLNIKIEELEKEKKEYINYKNLYEEITTKFEEEKNNLSQELEEGKKKNEKLSQELEEGKKKIEKLSQELEEGKMKIEKLSQELNDEKNKNDNLTLENKKYLDILQRNKNKYIELNKKYDNLINNDKITKEKINTLLNEMFKYHEEEKNKLNDALKSEECFDESIIGFNYKCSVCHNNSQCQKSEEKIENSEDNNIFINDYMENNSILINDINLKNKVDLFVKKEDKNDSSSNMIKKFLDEKSKIEKSYDKLINEIINNYSNEKETYELKLKEKENKIK